jgi:outer membrane lipoprotein-sorting protein
MTEVSSSRTAFHRRPDRNGAGRGRGRRQGVRALLPLGIVAVVAVGVAVSPSLASANPALPSISAQALLTKLATTKADAYSGTLSVTTNLGLPALPDLSGGADPISLLSGTHVIQVAADGPDQQRLGLLADESEYDLVHNGQQVWIYDSEQNSVEQGTLPAEQGKTGQGKSGQGKRGLGAGQRPAKESGADVMPLTPAQAVQQLITAITPTTGLAVTGTQNVAGQAAYKLVITPKQKGSLIDRIEIAVDAQNGAPLSVALYSAKATGTPVLQLGFSSVSFTAPPASRFEFTPPKGATVTPLSGGSAADGPMKSGGGAGSVDPLVLGQGWLSVLEVHGANVADGLNGINQFDGKPQHQGRDNSAQNPNGLFNGDIGSYLQELGNAGTHVSGAFGTGTLYTTNFVTVLATGDGRLFVGAVTPALLEADASAQGNR